MKKVFQVAAFALFAFVLFTSAKVADVNYYEFNGIGTFDKSKCIVETMGVRIYNSGTIVRESVAILHLNGVPVTKQWLQTQPSTTLADVIANPNSSCEFRDLEVE